MIKFTSETIGYINLFENLTRSRVKDCYILKDEVIFIVHEGEAGKAIGRDGVNIKKASMMLKKKIKVVEFNSNPEKFVENMISPQKGKIYMKDDNTLMIEGKGARFKEAVLGRERQNLKELQEIVSNYFGIKVEVA